MLLTNTNGSTSSLFLFSILNDGMKIGITASGTGFYGPQGRSLLNEVHLPLQDLFSSFNYQGHRITNFDMETSALYGLGKLYGFQCFTCNAIIANRLNKTYHENHLEIIDRLIENILGKITSGSL